MSNDGPDNKPTPAAGTLSPVVAVSAETLGTVLTTLQGMSGQLGVVAQDVAELKQDTGGLKGDMREVKGDVRDLKTRLADVEERQRRHSGGTQQLADDVRETSSVNLKQDAAIGVLVGKVDALGADVADLKMSQATQTTILQLLESGTKTLAGNPHVRLLVGLLWTALLGYLASKGLASK